MKRVLDVFRLVMLIFHQSKGLCAILCQLVLVFILILGQIDNECCQLGQVFHYLFSMKNQHSILGLGLILVLHMEVLKNAYFGLRGIIFLVMVGLVQLVYQIFHIKQLILHQVQCVLVFISLSVYQIILCIILWIGYWTCELYSDKVLYCPR